MFLSLAYIFVSIREAVPLFAFRVFYAETVDLLNTGLGLGILTGRSLLLG